MSLARIELTADGDDSRRRRKQRRRIKGLIALAALVALAFSTTDPQVEPRLDPVPAVHPASVVIAVPPPPQLPPTPEPPTPPPAPPQLQPSTPPPVVHARVTPKRQERPPRPVPQTTATEEPPPSVTETTETAEPTPITETTATEAPATTTTAAQAPPPRSRFKDALKKIGRIAIPVVIGAVIVNNTRDHGGKQDQKQDADRRIDVSPRSLNVTERSVVTVTNIGRDEVTINSIQIEDESGLFWQSNDCRHTLAPRQQCRVSVSMKQLASARATLVVDSTAGHVTVGLAGSQQYNPR